MKRTAIVLALTALALSGDASGHPGTAQTGYVSTVSALEPPVLGVDAIVLGGDDRLRISNYSGKTIVVLGYEDEPYLRFDKQGVWANTRSPAAHLNRFRHPRSLAPGVADAGAPPSWRRVAPGVTYEWHDHRIHWTAAEPPEGVREHPDRIQRIFTWRVPGSANGKRFAITGFLGYAPDRVAGKDDGGIPTWLVLLTALAAAALLAAALVGVGARRTRRRAPVAP
jgi:hypothetical protein